MRLSFVILGSTGIDWIGFTGVDGCGQCRKTDVTPAILSHHYRTTKLQYATVHVAHSDFVT